MYKDYIEFYGDIEVVFNDPEFRNDEGYMQRPVFKLRSVESDGGIEDYGNAILES